MSGALVFVVEDDVELRLTLVEVLRMEGFRVEAASQGQQALEALLQAAETPSLILLDLQMPVMSGTEFLKRRAEHAHLSSIPVIGMSASPPDQLSGLSGADRILQKPVELDELIEAIRAHLTSPLQVSNN